ncbi:DUF892 family protein [Pigmentiphaga soli]|uniref:DUF892 family protein n=1 Tax=Pigmentiphaga soli TaxID=1007095 RepID=A0ABP8GXY4_9BURK
MPDSKEHLMDWLRDAHAMEQQAEQMLTSMSGRIENYPDLKARVDQHIGETRNQALKLERCIQRLGGDTSAIKDMTGRAMAMMQGLAGMFASDEVVKGAMASYAFEHLEIAAYTELCAAARTLGDTQTLQTCEEILEEEKAMAAWLGEHLSAVTQRFLVLSDTAGSQAKR